MIAVPRMISFFRKTLGNNCHQKTALRKFIRVEESDYPFQSRRYAAFERATVSFLLKQDLIEPNHITYFRFLIGFFLLLFSYRLSYLQILALATLGAASDFLDGALARSASKKTRLGIILDPLADKFLVFTLLYILVIRKALDPIYLLWMLMVEGHVLLVPILSWFYRLLKVNRDERKPISGGRDMNSIILTWNANLVGKVKFCSYAFALLGLFLGRAFDSPPILEVANWLLIFGILTGAFACCSYVFRWFTQPY